MGGALRHVCATQEIDKRRNRVMPEGLPTLVSWQLAINRGSSTSDFRLELRKALKESELEPYPQDRILRRQLEWYAADEQAWKSSSPRWVRVGPSDRSRMADRLNQVGRSQFT